jgi:hypothetical protein
LAGVGLLKTLRSVGTTLSFFYRYLIRRPFDNYERYGDKDSWVVVTGGSDGIGLEICK